MRIGSQSQMAAIGKKRIVVIGTVGVTIEDRPVSYYDFIV